MDSDDGEEVDMELESEEDGPSQSVPAPSASRTVRSGKPGSSNPYPLEGKYIDEDDREE